MSALLGVDLGGTSIRSLVVDDAASAVRIVGRDQRATPRTGAADVVESLVASARAACARAGVPLSALGAIGCASAGPVDHRTGVVHLAPNIPGFLDFPLGPRLAAALGVAVALDLDTAMAAVGEALAGAARGSRDFVYVTVSTGLGGAIVSGGRMLRGSTATAGELGHWPVSLTSAPGAPRCGCGAVGCAEAYAAGGNLAARFGGADTAAVYAAARAGDRRALALVADAEEALGSLAVGITNVLNPEKIIVGGSVAEHQPSHVLEPMRRAIRSRAFAVPAAVVRIVPAALGGDVGPIGAALAARERMQGRGEWFTT